ncbi:trypco2 family protein [Streptomyces sp. NBC_00271]|uniref:trypco2 family protein n=1 Tax=Streptomyces sp. NBC_00271 TaxID=2975697 RepID=UPI002E2B7B70|nr:trypco2 family protein [Streptomyces sp. NBC_00271]
MPGDDYVGLAEAIEIVRSELAQARVGGDGQGIRFDVASVVVEFGGEVRREGPAGNSLHFYVTAGDGAATTGSSHRISVTLEAVDGESGLPLRISDRSNGAPVRPQARR